MKLDIEFILPDSGFRESAIQGGSNFTLGNESSVQAAGHEFGHLLGFDDTYIESTQLPIQGFSNDIMASRYGVVLWQHAAVLGEKYAK